MEHRLTKLESSVEFMQKDIAEIKEKIDVHTEQHRIDQIKIEDRFSGIEKGLMRDKGFIGGVVFVISAVWAFLVFWLK